MIQVTNVKPLGGHLLQVTFSDGRRGIWDYSAVLTMTGSMAQPLHDPAYFAQAFVQDGAIAWPNGFDSCPQATRMEIEAAGMMDELKVPAE